MLWILFVVYASMGGSPEEVIPLHTEFPLTTLEECTKLAEKIAVRSVNQYPELAKYKFYQCQKESI